MVPAPRYVLCGLYNKSFLPAISAFSLPSILLPELPGSIKHRTSDVNPKMSLKWPPHL